MRRGYGCEYKCPMRDVDDGPNEQMNVNDSSVGAILVRICVRDRMFCGRLRSVVRAISPSVSASDMYTFRT
jgi:hypothetical protein